MADQRPVFLSYTAAKRYEKCHYLQYAHRQKITVHIVDEKPFLAGRAVHGAFEPWLNSRGTPPSLAERTRSSWTAEETPMVQAGSLRWSTPTERFETYAKAITVAHKLEQMIRATNLLSWHLLAEERYSVPLEFGVSIYANPDIYATVPGMPVAFVVELKSGVTYDPDQAVWYAATIRAQHRLQGLTVPQFYALPLRPAVADGVEAVAITDDQMDAQVERVLTIGRAMRREEWEPTPGSYCSICEARTTCPSYASTFGNVQRGRNTIG